MGDVIRKSAAAEDIFADVKTSLVPALARAAVDALRKEAANLRAAMEPARVARAEGRLTARIVTSLARAAQLELVNIKRRYRAEGYSEAEIHQVIPDRPRVVPVVPT